MQQPDFSNKAQQAQEKATAPDLKKPAQQADETGPRLKPPGDGAVRGGEQTKPGQMAGDEDIPATASQDDVERAVRGPASDR